MCSVLTDTPLNPATKSIKNSNCGKCKICKEICPVDAIKEVKPLKDYKLLLTFDNGKKGSLI